MGDGSCPQTEIPIVQSDSTYRVLADYDIVYAEALRHDGINSADAITIPLMLDVYYPDNDIKNRPVFFFIHGGGFAGGSKQQAQIIKWANYYTSRGWVFISIDYRLRKHKGTLPQQWTEYVNKLPEGAKVGQLLAIYPALRDAKAALRWVVANAGNYNINTNYITVGGGSAGAIAAIGVGISNQEDFRDEISSKQDPTLESTNRDQSYQIRTIIDLWGSKIALDVLKEVYGHQRFDRNDPSLFIVHGTKDALIPFSSAEDLKALYEANGVPFAYFPLKEKGHGPWNATVNNKRLEELAFKFITEQQKIMVQ